MDASITVALIGLVGVVIPALASGLVAIILKRSDKRADELQAQADQEMEYLRTLATRVDTQEQRLTEAYNRISSLEVELLQKNLLVLEAKPVLLWVSEGAQPPAPYISPAWRKELSA